MYKKSIKIEYYYCTVKTNNKYTFVIIDNRNSLLFRNRLKRISFNYLLHHIKYKEICFIYYGRYDTVKIKEETISGINSEDIRKVLIKIIKTTTGLLSVKKDIDNLNELYYNYKNYHDNFHTKL